MELQMVTTVKMIFAFIGGWLLGFAAGYLVASSVNGSIE